ncbi:hypothetical protein VM1G_11793 [Cytospora mali]|uniref:Uncharacterized protein n=1 Tax=Cytospora mali TaxID=578113 RepID=A0A194W7K9_CYTMA|nr:hypothetical protein VM1G_11793 [Valsa mali]
MQDDRTLNLFQFKPQKGESGASLYVMSEDRVRRQRRQLPVYPIPSNLITSTFSKIRKAILK